VPACGSQRGGTTVIGGSSGSLPVCKPPLPLPARRIWIPPGTHQDRLPHVAAGPASWREGLANLTAQVRLAELSCPTESPAPALKGQPLVPLAVITPDRVDPPGQGRTLTVTRHLSELISDVAPQTVLHGSQRVMNGFRVEMLGTKTLTQNDSR
jgi:hypothetical protein